jgi:general stress protein 26
MTRPTDNYMPTAGTSTAMTVWSMMDKMPACMVVTHDGAEDRLRARPMMALVRPEHNAVFFLTDTRNHKDEEISKNDNVCLTFSDSANQKYVSVTGTGFITADPILIGELWSMAASAWWSSKDDPNIRVLRVTPSRAEFWNSPDMITTDAQSAAKALSGNRPNCGTNGKVTF